MADAIYRGQQELVKEYIGDEKNLFDRNLKIEITTDNKKLTVKEDKIIIAGPCAIESYDQLLKTAKFVKSKGANILRGGAYKPRTSPNSFQGLKEEGLEILKAVKRNGDGCYNRVNGYKRA